MKPSHIPVTVFLLQASSRFFSKCELCFCFCVYLSVRAGVDHFKHGRHVEAMNEYNKALEIDMNNVEALVARGAL